MSRHERSSYQHYQYSNVDGVENVREFGYDRSPGQVTAYYRTNGVEYILHPTEDETEFLVDKYKDGEYISSLYVSPSQLEEIVQQYASQMFLGNFDTPLALLDGPWGDIARELSADLDLSSTSAPLGRRRRRQSTVKRHLDEEQYGSRVDGENSEFSDHHLDIYDDDVDYEYWNE